MRVVWPWVHALCSANSHTFVRQHQDWRRRPLGQRPARGAVDMCVCVPHALGLRESGQRCLGAGIRTCWEGLELHALTVEIQVSIGFVGPFPRLSLIHI